ncbi:hypothetical protein, partial [Candidatus Magnetobacterium casense]|uniref:hypothetical protein n=1 Tax=Candidatus Magnetobacterium casense TaxID=1455061 RepID=UPI001C43DD16
YYFSRVYPQNDIADFDWIKYKIRGIFTGSRGLVPLRVGLREGRALPSFFVLHTIETRYITQVQQESTMPDCVKKKHTEKNFGMLKNFS